MSRWGSDPEGAADQLIRRSLDDLGLQGRVLLAYTSDTLATEVARGGAAVSTWHRRVAAGQTATPWPQGTHDHALLRLPRAKEEQEMAAHAVLSCLAPGGRLIVYGGNDEGIRSAGTMLEALCGRVETLATRGHGRILAVSRPGDLSRLRAPLAAWRSLTSLNLGGVTRDWVSYPGIFADGRIDDGTGLLIAHLPPLAASARVLDYGCGSGLIAAAARMQQPDLALDLLDHDTVALEAARENLPGARLVLGTKVPDAGKQPYAAILSNPPLHTGAVEDHTHLSRLIDDAPKHLVAGGILLLVVQRRIPLDRLLTKQFASVATVGENATYRVWKAVR
jgi:16S rRNA (guanine1207-N2)-methyltransferase